MASSSFGFDAVAAVEGGTPALTATMRWTLMGVFLPVLMPV